MKNWKQKQDAIRKDAEKSTTQKCRRSSANINRRKKGKYPEEEDILHKKYKVRRAKGLVVDGQYLKTQMKLLVRESGKDKDNKFKGGDKWLHNFTKRNGISKQRKTNNKSHSIIERLPQVKNFHWYTIYQMATEDP